MVKVGKQDTFKKYYQPEIYIKILYYIYINIIAISKYYISVFFFLISFFISN